FIIGRFYQRYGAPRAAVDRFEYLLKTYPNYGARDKVMYYLAVAYAESNSTEESKKTFEMLKKEYPNSPYAADHPKVGV
ncbi:MAG TPA: tetratricopeptide repeat protein, partial [Thermoanaerobaculia bacterium]|nr:tetratricopeptide repeat protein [Thermoanaerobaculia bacterium]